MSLGAEVPVGGYVAGPAYGGATGAYGAYGGYSGYAAAPGYGGAIGGQADPCTEACGAACGPACGAACGPACGVATCGGALCGGADGSVLSYVGGGRGRYMQETSYKYVGAGAGDFDVIPVAAPRPRVCCWCLPILCLLPLLILLLQPGTTTTSTLPPLPPVIPTPPPPTTRSPPGTCTIYGDPHVMTFDQMHLDFYSPGEYWIVKSDTVKIQGKYLPTHMTHGLAVTKQIGVSGPFIKNHKLIIGPRSATFDGTLILEAFPSSWSNADAGITARYDSYGELLQKGRQGKALHVIHLSLPLGVRMQINRWTEASEGDYINTKITMSAVPGQDGHCGNFNGNNGDDDRLKIRARVGKTGVPADELIFPGPKTPVVQSNRPDINDCPQKKLEAAEALCKKSEHAFFPSKECLIDVCFGGKGFAEHNAQTR